MVSQRKAKISGYALFMYLLNVFAVAQLDQQGGILDRGVNLLEVTNQFLLYDITSLQSLAIFLAIWAGLYYATKPLLNEIFGVLLEIFPERNSRSISRGNSQDVVDRSVVGLSLVSSFVAAQYLGWVIGGIALIIIASLSILLIVVYYVFSAGRFASSGVSSVGSLISDRGSTTDSGSTASQELDVAEKETDKIQKNIEGTESEIEDVEGTGNDGEARDAAQREEKIIMSIEDVEEKINHALSLEEKQLQHTVGEAERVLKEEKEGVQGLRDIQNRYEEIQQLLNVLVENMDSKIEQGKTSFNSSQFHSGVGGFGSQDYGEGGSASGFRTVLEDIEGCKEDVKKISDIEGQEVGEVREEVQEVHREVQNFVEAYDLIGKARKMIKEAEEEDKELEQVARELGDRELMKLVEKEEEQEMQLEERIKNLIEKEDMIEKELEDAAEIIGEELEAGEEEIREIKQEVSETDQIENELLNIRNNYVQYFGPKAREGINERISKAIEDLDNIGKGMKSIEKRKEKEFELLNKAENDIREAVSEVSG